MINSQFDNFIEKMQSLRMTSEEKADVLQRSLFAIDIIESAHAASLEGHLQHGVKSAFMHTWEVYFKEKKFVPTFIMAAILLIFGGVSVVAEQALPGDSLYSLKVNVNEQVRGLAALTPEAKAKFALEVTDQRLKEVALLSSQGRLDDSTRQMLESQLQVQAGNVKNQVASLVAVNNVKAAQEIAVSLESSLKAHELILEKISSDQASTSTSSPHIGAILNAVKTELATSTESRAGLQAKELNLDAYNKEKVIAKLADSSIKYDEFKGIFAKATPSTSTLSVVLAYNGQINQFITDARFYVAEGKYPLALVKLQQVDQLISDAEAILNADSTTSVTIKNIVNLALSNATTTFSPVTIPADTSTSTKVIDTPKEATSTIPVANASSTEAVTTATTTITQ